MCGQEVSGKPHFPTRLKPQVKAGCCHESTSEVTTALLAEEKEEQFLNVPSPHSQLGPAVPEYGQEGDVPTGQHEGPICKDMETGLWAEKGP